jgi:HSP20 family protein
MTMVMEPVAPLLRELNRYVGGTSEGFSPPADVLVTDEDVKVHMDVPGVGRENLEIELENDVLTVRGERPYPYGTGDGAGGRTWQRIERRFGRFERELRIPRGLDPNTIEASLTNGVLSLRIPKPEPLKPHRIEIRTAESEQPPQTVEATTS